MDDKVLSAGDIARMIDISAVQASHGESEIHELIEYTFNYGFGCVHVLAAWVPFARKLMGNATDALLGSPVGFPSGGNHTLIKRMEALQLVEDGVDELDMMINVGKLRSGDQQYVLDEIRTITEAVDVPVKVILETHYLTDKEIKIGCDLCIQGDAAYVKTSTGWAETGATIENVTLISNVIRGQIGIKAAGGIRDLATLVEMYRLGVRRFGVNIHASVDIINQCKQLPDGVVRVT